MTEPQSNQTPADSTEQVLDRCMAPIDIDIDEDACAAVMHRFDLATEREAVNLALRRLATEALDLHDARALPGSGWPGGLDVMRANRAS